MSLINSQVASTLVTAGDAGSTFQGPSEIAEGNFLSGVKKIVAGPFAIKLSGLFLSSYEGFCGNIIKGSLLGGVISVMAYSGVTIIRIGAKDIAKQHYTKGMSKVLLGITGVASAVYYVSSHFFNELPSNLGCENEKDIERFLEKHKAQLTYMSRSIDTVPGWTKLGEGVSKKAVFHPDLPNCVIKLSKEDTSNWGNDIDDLEFNYERSQEMRIIAEKFPRIVVPNSYLFKMPEMTLLVEDKLDFLPYESIESSAEKTKAELELDEFLQESDLCDVFLEINHNAGFLRGANSRELSVGVFDFDCVISILERKFSPINKLKSKCLGECFLSNRFKNICQPLQYKSVCEISDRETSLNFKQLFSSALVPSLARLFEKCVRECAEAVNDLN